MYDDDLTATDVEQLLEDITRQEKIIKAAEDKRDELIDHYQLKTLAAQQICDNETQQAREEISYLTDKLRSYAESHITGKKRSLKFPSGTLAFRKQSPKFFFSDDLKEANAKDDRLIHFVKHNAYEYLKVKVDESVDWAAFKAKLKIDGDNVFYAETGELIDGLHAQIMPDKFTVQTS